MDWYPSVPATPGHVDSGEAALKVLEDVHLVRSLLDTAELNAVHTARHHGASWAQITTALHMTKQSAWERWHESDDRGQTSP